jgi:hypothetical protein
VTRDVTENAHTAAVLASFPVRGYAAGVNA